MAGSEGGCPRFVTVAGSSMEPTLPEGSVVSMAPLERLPIAGEVVLLRTAGGLLLHRVVRCCGTAGDPRIVHSGDGGGKLGVAPGSAVVGVARGRLEAGIPSLPTMDGLGRRVRRRFARARVRALAYALLFRCASALGMAGRRPAAFRAVGRFVLQGWS